MRAYDSTLKLQHDSILNLLEMLEERHQDGQIAHMNPLLHELFDLVCLHHHAEWTEIYSSNFRNSNLNQGGPYCTYFFDTFLRERPQEKVLQLIRSLSQEKYHNFNFEIPGELNSVFEINSMMSIPLEEHLAIQKILQCMIHTWDEEGSQNSPWYQKALRLLGNLVRKNIEKEETCLWLLLQQTCPNKKETP